MNDIVLKDFKHINKIEFCNSKDLKISFLENGSLFSIIHNNIMINQVFGNPVEDSVTNIYIRLHKKGSIDYFPIIGSDSESDFYYDSDCLCFSGEKHGIKYLCSLVLDKSENVWFWNVELKNISGDELVADVVFVQDVGIANANALRINEAYNSHYVDNEVLKHSKYGHVLCFRQNQAQDKEYPWLMLGCLDKCSGYSTDGFQFFGLKYKESNEPEALHLPKLSNKKMQYEFTLPALLSAKKKIKPESKANVTYFVLYENNHKEATDKSDLGKIEIVEEIFGKINLDVDITSLSSIKKEKSLFNNVNFFEVKDLNILDIDMYFGQDRRHLESKDSGLLSFFYGNGTYVTFKSKELETRRPHGHILRSGKSLFPGDNILSTTSYMYGVFNSQLTIGNTSFNKLLSVTRNHLNILKSSGQRIFVKGKKGYELLGIPSAFEVGLNHCRWIYKGQESTIIVKTWVSMDEPACFLEIETKGNENKEFIISNNIVLGVNEFDSQGTVKINESEMRIELFPAKNEQILKQYEETLFYICTNDANKINSIASDGLLYESNESEDNPYVTIRTKPTNRFSLFITGSILDRKEADAICKKYLKFPYKYENALVSSVKFWKSLSSNFNLSFEKNNEELEKVNDIFLWFMHNAMIHYTVPHGLEQYSGAAWGVRDVCQGPVELLIATQNHKSVKEILKLVFSHQYNKSANWPQWFMFDRFVDIQQHECHGDVIIWPLKALCDYIESTNDFSILNENVSYMDEDKFSFTNTKETIFKHCQSIINKIVSECIPGTSLLSYGDGDWNDTLQPADASMRKRMVSGWTVELLYQTLRRFSLVCEKAKEFTAAEEIEAFSDKLKDDFNKYVISNDVVSGFVYFHDNKKIDCMLHPSDKKTGIKYRLLPMTRGMISQIFTKEQVKKHYKIIKSKLYFPDGVRLMEPLPKYMGGIQRFFKRAETAACFGREIGQQYVHAHIRFIEAMAKIGEADEVYRALMVINPIKIDKVVPAAGVRQSNAYFSSSDADFSDRYIARKNFLKLKKSKVTVNGGWRIYSSGPGIYINQVVANFLGIRDFFDDIVFDPVIPKRLNGLCFDFKYADKLLRIKYNIKSKSFSPYQVTVNGLIVEGTRYEENPYRKGGLLIKRSDFLELLTEELNLIEVFM